MMSGPRKTASVQVSHRYYGIRVERFAVGNVGIAIALLFVIVGCADADFGVPGGGKNNVQCPVECACLGNVVDCSGLQLIGAPSGLPPWTEIL